MVSQLKLPSSGELLKGEVEYIPVGENEFDQSFKQRLVEVGDNDRRSWTRTTFRRPRPIKNGITVLHREFGNIGRRDATSAAIMYGFDCYQAEYGDAIKNIADIYFEKVRTAESLTESPPSVQPTFDHELKMAPGKQSTLVEPSRDGRIAELADVFNVSKSLLYRHFAGIAIAHSHQYGNVEYGRIAGVADNYEQALDHAIEQQINYITGDNNE